MIDKEDLRRLAQAASPGPWRVVKDHEFPGVHGGDVILGGSFCDYSVPTREDEEFIAAANPVTVIELLDEIEWLRAVFEAAREVLQYGGPYKRVRDWIALEKAVQSALSTDRGGE